MKLKLLIWIIGIFLLALPSVFANTILLNRSFILGDSFAHTSYPNMNYGANPGGLTTYVGASPISRMYIQWNITNISLNPTCSSGRISNVTLHMSRWDGDSGSWVDKVYEVNGTFGEGNKNEQPPDNPNDLTWNNQPCGTGTAGSFPSNPNICNGTAESGTLVDTLNTMYKWEITGMVKKAVNLGYPNVTMVFRGAEEGAGINFHNYFGRENTVSDALAGYLNVTCTSTAADTTPPNILSYNLSTPSGDCTSWPSGTCSTGDTTPTVNFTTTEPAWCAIGIQSVNFSQYANLGVDRNCTIGQGASSHTCTLIPGDELAFEDSNIYISCRDSGGNENMTGKSTSGPLSLRITGLEAGTDAAIGVGVQNALLSGYTNYTSQQIYARKLDGTQDYGTFDWVAKKGSKVWAFNHITKGETHVGMFNLTPVLYVLEMANNTNSTIINLVETMVNTTK